MLTVRSKEAKVGVVQDKRGGVIHTRHQAGRDFIHRRFVITTTSNGPVDGKEKRKQSQCLALLVRGAFSSTFGLYSILINKNNLVTFLTISLSWLYFMQAFAGYIAWKSPNASNDPHL